MVDALYIMLSLKVKDKRGVERLLLLLHIIISC